MLQLNADKDTLSGWRFKWEGELGRNRTKLIDDETKKIKGKCSVFSPIPQHMQPLINNSAGFIK
jgi:hypothetical protein